MVQLVFIIINPIIILCKLVFLKTCFGTKLCKAVFVKTYHVFIKSIKLPRSRRTPTTRQSSNISCARTWRRCSRSATRIKRWHAEGLQLKKEGMQMPRACSRRGLAVVAEVAEGLQQQQSPRAAAAACIGRSERALKHLILAARHAKRKKKRMTA